MFLLLGCLLNRDLYDERRAALADADGDGYASEDDCNDDNAAVNPAANEICDGLDNDCDGSVDEDATDATLWYQDADGDGYGNPVEVVASCTEPAGFVAKGGDCDDSVATVHPGAAETPYDGIDQDCDGADVTDIDGDGYDAVVAGGTDCDDFDALTFPGAGESWDRAYVDSDCDGDLAEQLLEFGTSVSVGRTAEGRAGANLAPLGDVDGDGSAAFLVAAYYDGAKYDYGGAIFVVRGSEPGRLSEQQSIEADGEAWFLGTGMDGGRDIDGDGRPELAVGATGYDGGRGLAALVSSVALEGGGQQSLLSVAAASVSGSEAEAYLGSQVRLIADTDGDGADELFIAAPCASVGGLELAGAVYGFDARALMSGGFAVTDAEAEIAIRGPSAEAYLGNNVHGLGDQDGDGLADLALSDGLTTLWVVLGGSGSGDVKEVAVSTVLDAVADTRTVGDLDGDGRLDLFVLGANAALYTDLKAAGTWTRDEAYSTFSAFGDAFTEAIDLGDLSGDGRSETMLFVSSLTSLGTGWAGVVDSERVRFGATIDLGEERLQAVSTRPDSAFGFRAVVAGDIAGDGAHWFAVGGPRDDEGGADAGAVALLPVPR
jgi:hypothetical protein